MNYFCSLYPILKNVKLFEKRNIFIYSIFTIIYFFISVPKILPQVKIKESIVITPQNAGLKFVNSVSNTSHTIRLVGEWEQVMLGPDEDIPMNRQRFKIRTSCGDDIYSPSDLSGYTEFSFSAEYGTNYNIQFLNAQRTLWDPTYRDEGAYGGPFNVYIDGQSYSSAINSTSVKPWFSYIGFQIYGKEIDHDCSLSMTFAKVQSCEPIIGSMNDDWPEISIIKGGEYLSFYVEEDEDTLGDSFDLGDYRSNVPKLLYEQPYYKDREFDGILKAELNGTSLFDTVRINKVEDFKLIVEIEPKEIEPGDSADIHLLQDLGFDEIEFPPEQLFKVEIIDGSQYGTIVAQNGTDTSDIFNNISQGFTFRAGRDIMDSVEVYIKVSTILESGIFVYSRDESDKSEMNKTMTINKNDAVNPELSNTNLSGSNPNWIFFPPEENREIYGIGKVVVKNDDIIEIMLGESKYFQAIYPDPTTDSLVIEEVRIGSDGIPELNGGLPLDTIWAGNPVEIVTNADTSGRRCGVYWETQKPVWVNTTNMGNLQDGIIRIIGRYWHRDSSYVVKLKARVNDDTVEVRLRVIRPNILYTNSGNLTSNYIFATDVLDNPLNIDSLCNLFGGENGIPPQIIKGQFYTEAHKDHQRFYPSYRYEPFSDLRFQRINNDVLNSRNCFVVDSITMGTGDPIPGTHINVEPIEYPLNPIMVNAFLADNIRQYISGQRIFYNSDEAVELNNYLRSRYNLYQMQLVNHPFDNALIDLTDQIRDGSFQSLNRIAQTRIVASYGLTQQTYYNAVDPDKEFYGFSRRASDHPPELLNHQTYFMNVYVERMRWYANENDINLNDNNWAEGYEGRWDRSLLSYNPHNTNYHTNVMNNSMEFLPIGD